MEFSYIHDHGFLAGPLATRMIPSQSHAQQVRSHKHHDHKRPQLPRLQSKFEKLRHLHGPPLYTHCEEEEDVECGHSMESGRDLAQSCGQCHLNQSACTYLDHPSGVCTCRENVLSLRKVASLERRVRIGSWVAMMVLLLLTVCFVIRELLVDCLPHSTDFLTITLVAWMTEIVRGTARL